MYFSFISHYLHFCTTHQKCKKFIMIMTVVAKHTTTIKSETQSVMQPIQKLMKMARRQYICAMQWAAV